MENQFIPQAVEIVKQAIAADQAGDYEKALPLYKRSLEYFMTGLKYEKNPAARDTIKAVSFAHQLKYSVVFVCIFSVWMVT